MLRYINQPKNVMIQCSNPGCPQTIKRFMVKRHTTHLSVEQDLPTTIKQLLLESKFIKVIGCKNPNFLLKPPQ